MCAVAAGIQALQEGKKLGDDGPEISIIRGHWSSSNVHPDRIIMHTRWPPAQTHHAPCGCDPIKETEQSWRAQ